MYDCWSLCLLLFFIYNVIADIDSNKADSNLDFDDNRLAGYKSHSDIKTKWQFLNRQSLPIEQAPFAKPSLSPSKLFYKIPIAQSSSILLSLRNLGESTFNITSLTGYLHAAHRNSFYVQNSTARFIGSRLGPNSEMTLEYRFNPWQGLPAVDYVFSCDVEYKLVPNQETESKRLAIEYKHKFMNVTVSVYDSNPMGYIDFQLFFMTISIVVFWAFIGVLFYELWWIPNQEAQGKQPLPTVDMLSLVYHQYVLMYFYVLREKALNKPNPMKNGQGLKRGGSASNLSSAGNSPKNSKDAWLSGTSASSKKKKKKKN